MWFDIHFCHYILYETDKKSLRILSFLDKLDTPDNQILGLSKDQGALTTISNMTTG